AKMIHSTVSTTMSSMSSSTATPRREGCARALRKRRDSMSHGGGAVTQRRRRARRKIARYPRGVLRVPSARQKRLNRVGPISELFGCSSCECCGPQNRPHVSAQSGDQGRRKPPRDNRVTLIGV